MVPAQNAAFVTVRSGCSIVGCDNVAHHRCKSLNCYQFQDAFCEEHFCEHINAAPIHFLEWA